MELFFEIIPLENLICAALNTSLRQTSRSTDLSNKTLHTSWCVINSILWEVMEK